MWRSQTCENRMYNFDFEGDRVTTEFKVNKEKRTVVCIITAINDVPLRLEKYGLADEDYDDILYDVRQYTGIAKCAPGDKWDETYGRRLAEYRAACERMNDVNEELKKYIRGVMRCVDNLWDYGLMKYPREPREPEV